MMYEEWRDGKLVLRWNEINKTVERMDADGTTVVATDPMSPEQIEVAEAFLAEEARQANAIALREKVKLIITDLKLEKDRVQPVIDTPNAQITGSHTKDVARAAKRIADAAIDLARLLTE